MTNKPRNWIRSRYSKVVPRLQRELKPGVAFLAIQWVDFDCTPMSFASQMCTLARDHGMRATCAVFTDRVVYVFYHPESFLRPNLPAYAVVKKMRG